MSGSRLARRLAELRGRGEGALGCYVTAGDPSPELTVEIACALADGGADFVELGLPFSDPLADGPANQASAARALAAGTGTRRVLRVVEEVRRLRPQLPLLLMGYYNPLLRYGPRDYLAAASQAGADAHIVIDLIPEEAEEWAALSAAAGLDSVFMVAPTSTEERVRAAARLSTGFLYGVSRTGVTGVRGAPPADLAALVAGTRAATDLPVCVGFGISRPEQVSAVCAAADGAIVGSALVERVHRWRAEPDLPGRVGAFAAELKQATRPGAHPPLELG